ncbi:Conserved repeat domain-containing protein [Pseudomonas sp. 8AS]|uniref:DUF7507 domain-containing protein n=1 Tax=Pseudomonas sp. 8AS TaxID=2653163 RepID=UPI0012F24EE7|nr:hypothetical protein [Pseudomonas sp. 8AS]VXB08800.1 Conserved repeat domain-containing protein [Pseudomonas sp. 8AS]
MHTHSFLLRTLPRCLLAAALVAGVTTTAIYAVDGTPPGLFELDGNTVDVQPGGGDDWGSLHLGTQLGTPAGTTVDPDTGNVIIDDPAPLTIFTQGGSKDINDVSDWRYTDGSVPDKDDITNAYAAAYTVPAGGGDTMNDPGDLIIYFGLDRYANNGDAFAGFWFFQDEVGLGPNKQFNGVHTPGDLLVLVEYPQGANAVPEIKVYEWVTSGGNVAEHLNQIFTTTAQCDGAGDKLACAITNHGNLSGEPAWPYTPKNGFAGIPLESFYEGGINVSKLLGGDVPCFSSFLAETRSSRSETAQLKDFVLGDFDLCSIAVTKECEATVNDQDGGNSVVVNFSGTVTNDGGLKLFGVTVTDDMGTPGNTADDEEIPIGDLEPGASANYSGAAYTTLSIPATDTVTAEGHRNGTSVTAEASDTCSPQIEPLLNVTKQCDETVVNGTGDGIVVNFSGTVSNPGLVALEDVNVMDDAGTPGDSGDDINVFGGAITLNAGESKDYTGQYSVPGTASSLNTVTATGVDVLAGTPVEALPAPATCEATVTPGIAVTKECTGATINAGGTGILAEFAGTVTNTGNVKLTGVTVVDDQVGGDGIVLGPIDLGPGESAPYSGSYNASGFSSIDNVVASGTDVLTQTTPEANADATCSATPSPFIEVTKQCTDAPAFGQAILFDGTVTNSGNIALLGITVVDDNGTPGDVLDDVTFNLGDLAPGATTNYNGSYTPLSAGLHTNTVVAFATGADGSVLESEPANATCEVPPPSDLEGCTPGFWKNSPGSWVGYSPNQLITSVFSLPNGQINNQLGDDTLMEALNYGGGENLVGAAQNLLRSAVASLLNSTNPEVDDFPLTTAEVIAQVNAALATKDRATILALHAELDGYNNLGCDLPNDNSF